VNARMLRWDGCVNVRDLGGHPTEDGAETRFGAVVRADNIRGLTDEGWQALADYGVSAIVDLRFAKELAEDPPRDVSIQVMHVPLLGEPDSLAEVDALVEGVDDTVEWRRISYLAFLERYGANFARAVEAVARVPEGTVLIHCAGGVDRTGLVSALLLRMAGVGVEAVADDYAVSEQSWAPFVDEWITAAPDDRERRLRKLLSGMPAEAMRGVLEELERRHGSARGYLVDSGADEDDLDAVRARLRG
jgi:protein-tyrosine phosphatase